MSSKKSAELELRELLREKEEQIAGLMEEGSSCVTLPQKNRERSAFPFSHAAGEQLSKQQLTSNNIIKKLRSKEKQTEQLLASQR